MIAPGMLSNPPRIRTGRALSTISERLYWTPRLVPHMIPATSATNPAMAHVTPQIHLKGIPTDRAASWSSETALRALPVRVFWKNNTSTATNMAALVAANRSNWLNINPFSISHSTGVSGMPMLSPWTSVPHIPWPRPSKKNASPMVAIKRMMGGLATRGRSMIHSMAVARTIIAAKVTKNATHSGSAFSRRHTKVRAAKRTMAPWAKLNTPEAL